ncbi:guanine nucleotide exchange factor for Rab-3A-like isoform X2 [Rhodnius prolixus]|uniref:guanine nucleotide exchange factor for Rab-3A-like isoform X2 n=1 Tax=Rhodnius prolixus TaxID=13249 RepID=UPI003D18D8C9
MVLSQGQMKSESELSVRKVRGSTLFVLEQPLSHTNQPAELNLITPPEQEAHSMVREANVRQAGAEKSLKESLMQIEVLSAEVAALKALVLTSTPACPNPHLHPQIKDEYGGLLRRHRRSPSHLNLNYGRQSSPPKSPTNQPKHFSESPQPKDDVVEVDPIVHKEFLEWKENPTLDKSDPFIARIYREDIETCLLFTNKELSKQLSEGIQMGEIFIEAVSDKAKNNFPRDFERETCALKTKKAVEEVLLLMTMFNELWWKKIPELAGKLEFSKSTVDDHLKAMGKVKKLESWVPHTLNDRQKDQRYEICATVHCRNNSHPLLSRIVTCDEKWILYDYSRRSGQWLDKGEAARHFPKPPNKIIKKRKCALLETVRQCQYRLRIGNSETWHSISFMCRNRIIAVCDFLNYLRYIQRGLVKSSDACSVIATFKPLVHDQSCRERKEAHEIYWEIVRLRKEMVLARLGLALSS